MIAGREMPLDMRIPPVGIMERKPTEIMAVEDEEVRRAVHYIWSRVAAGVKVADILKRGPTSHSTLIRNFQSHLGRTPAEEIRRSCVETAGILLISTQRPLLQVAMDAGFTVLAIHQERVRLGLGGVLALTDLDKLHVELTGVVLLQLFQYGASFFGNSVSQSVFTKATVTV